MSKRQSPCQNSGVIRRFCGSSVQRMRRCGLVAVMGGVVIVALCMVAGGVIGGVVSTQLPVTVTALFGAVIGFLIGATAGWIMLGAVLGKQVRQAPTTLGQPGQRAPSSNGSAATS